MVLLHDAGVVLFHRSGDAELGVHGNAGLWRPEPGSHRLALVLYQTEVKEEKGLGGSESGREASEEAPEEAPEELVSYREESRACDVAPE